MRSSDTVQGEDVRAPLGGARRTAFDALLAMVAAAMAAFLSYTQNGALPEVFDLRLVANFLVVFVILLVGLVGYHRLVERRAATQMAWAATEDLRRAKDQFLANVSHGLRTPLTGIVGFADLLQSSLDKPADLENITTILGEAAELGRIVDDLVVAARLDADSLTVRLEEVSFAAQLEPVLQYMDLVGARVIVDSPEVNIRVDPELFRQVLRNLLANAHRHGRPQVMVHGRLSHGRFVCDVVDHGSGVPADLQGSLFSRFPYRPSGVIGHVGLGLAVVQQLCQRMGSEVDYRRVRGQTHFILSVPLTDEQPAPDGASSTRIEITPERLIRVRDRLIRIPA